MYQTMHRQPADLRRLLDEGWGQARQAADMLRPAQRIWTVGVGTSYHAALLAGWYLRAAGFDARAINSFEFAYYPENFPLEHGDAVAIFAHSGVKAVSSAAMRRAVEAGVTVISAGAFTAEHPGSQLILRTTEREQSAAFTASHLAAMTVFAQIATELGGDGTSGFREALAALPEQVEDILGRENDILPVAELAVERRIYASGAGPNEVAAIESVIKVREAAYGWIDALGSEQFLHGPVVAFNAGDLGIVINVPGAATWRTEATARVLAALDGEVWIVGQGVDGLANAQVFSTPETLELISPLLTVIPLQLLAYHMAVLKGLNPDTFRRDDPVYNAAFDGGMMLR
jgi:glucosamine--fructose-6-phosphate aminotransferase (isomerizing)